MGIPMMVDSDWLAAVDAFVRANTEGVPAPANAADSRFYDVRPAVLRTIWTWDDDALSWTCKFRFIVNGEQASTAYDCYAPSFLKSTAPPVSSSSVNPRVYVVWRGRWEVVSFVPSVPEYVGGDGINVDNVNDVISNTGVLGVYVGDSPTAPASSPSLQTGKICFSDDDFKLDDLDNDSIGWRAVALKDPPKPWKFAAGDGISVDVASDSTVTIANTAPNDPIEYSQEAAGAMLPATSGVIRSVAIASAARAYANVSSGVNGGVLTFTMPTGVPVTVVTNVSQNSDGTLNVTRQMIYVFSVVS